MQSGAAGRAAVDEAQGSCHVTCVDASRVVTSRASPGGAADVSGTQVGLLIVLWAPRLMPYINARRCADL